LTIYTQTPQINVAITASSFEPECGTYSMSLVDPAHASMVTLNGLTLQVGAAYNAPQGTFTIDIAHQRDSDASQKATATLQLTVIACTPSVAMNDITNQTPVADKLPYNMPLISLLTSTSYCIEDLTLTLELPGGSLQAWIALDATNPK